MMKRRTHIVRRVSQAKIKYRTKVRPVIAILDPVKSTLSVRLQGCRITKTYQLEDLYLFGLQRSLL